MTPGHQELTLCEALGATGAGSYSTSHDLVLNEFHGNVTQYRSSVTLYTPAQYPSAIVLSPRMVHSSVVPDQALLHNSCRGGALALAIDDLPQMRDSIEADSPSLGRPD